MKKITRALHSAAPLQGNSSSPLKTYPGFTVNKLKRKSKSKKQLRKLTDTWLPIFIYLYDDIDHFLSSGDYNE